MLKSSNDAIKTINDALDLYKKTSPSLDDMFKIGWALKTSIGQILHLENMLSDALKELNKTA